MKQDLYRSFTFVGGVLCFSIGALVACSGSSTTTNYPGVDSGGGGGTDGSAANTDSGGAGGTDSGGGTDAGSFPANGGPGDPCTPPGMQGSCATGGLCEAFPNSMTLGMGNFCTKPCAVAMMNPAPECTDAGAVFSGKCTPKLYCQIP